MDLDGHVIGQHKCIVHYTVGQRKGLGLALGYPAYVHALRPDTNEVVIGSEEGLFQRELVCRDLNFMSIEDLPAGVQLRCKAKIRYHHAEQDAVIERVGEDAASPQDMRRDAHLDCTADTGFVRVVFDEPVRAITPG